MLAPEAIVAIPEGIAYATGTAQALLGPSGGYMLGSAAGYWNYARIATSYGYGAYQLAPRVYSLFQTLQVELTANEAYINTQVFLGRQGYIWEMEQTSGLPWWRTLRWELQLLADKDVDLIKVPAPVVSLPNVR